MALLFFDGFDYYVTAEAGHKGWNMGNATIDRSVTRWPQGGSLRSPTTSPATRPLGRNYSALIAGLAFRVNGSGSNLPIFGFLDGSTLQVGLRWQGTSLPIQLVNNAGTVLATGSTNLQTGTWYYVELKVVFGGAGVGSAVVRINGVTEINYSGSTISTSNSYANGIRGPAGTTTADIYIDDLYLLDTSGSAPYNDFLGDVRVVVLSPNGYGSSTQWSPVGSAVNWDCVNDPISDDDLTFVASGTPGHRDLYSLEELPVSGQVLAVQIAIKARKDDAGTRTIRVVEKQGSNTRLGPEMALGTSWAGYITPIATTAPDGMPWDISKINSLEVGVEVVS
jgi:hypothetical protein